MKFYINLFFLSTSILLFTLTSCGEDPVDPPNPTKFKKGEGVFITQEGSFTSGNGTLSYYNFESDTLLEKVYEDQNNEVVGSVLQGAYFVNNQAYLVVNGSGVIIEIDPSTSKQLIFIPNLGSPNDFIIHEERNGFVSDLFGPYMYKLDMTTYLKADSLFVGGGTGELIVQNDKLFITKVSDFQSPPSTSVLVADPQTFEIMDTITVGFNPTSITTDGNGQLWVLCNGNPFEGRKGSIHRIDPENLNVATFIEFPDLNTSFAGRIEASEDGLRIYFLKGDVFLLDISAQSFPSDPFIAAAGRSFYALGVRPDNGNVYVGVEDFITESKIFIYDDGGNQVREMDAQLGVNHFYFY